jgi:aminocarboxymuconate-semialdehyde decarboxylase
LNFDAHPVEEKNCDDATRSSATREGEMTARREFIGGVASAMAGLVFVGCDLLNSTHVHAQGGPVRRREVVVDGRRVKTVDMHAHCAFPQAMALMGMKLDTENLVVGAERIRHMDEQGIDVEALSINPYWYKADRDVAHALINMQNEKLAELCAAEPDRFVAFATIALQHPDLAVEQLEVGIRKLGLRGVAIGGSVNGLELADPQFHPIWAKAEELGCLIFIHPQGNRELEPRLKGSGGLANAIGNPLETTIALSHLIYEGTLDRFPGLKICAAHGGGYLPSYAARSDAICTTFSERCAGVPLKKRPTEYLRQLYYDSLVFTSEALRHLIAEVGAGQIVMGTDYPFPWTNTSVNHILNTPGLSDADRAAMLGDTAARLLGIKA